jgi:hypothetical protein
VFQAELALTLARTRATIPTRPCKLSRDSCAPSRRGFSNIRRPLGLGQKSASWAIAWVKLGQSVDDLFCALLIHGYANKLVIVVVDRPISGRPSANSHSFFLLVLGYVLVREAPIRAKVSGGTTRQSGRAIRIAFVMQARFGQTVKHRSIIPSGLAPEAACS